jgi:mRNA-degrading endonuclease RelE of RelBE toxin-antitoxin system
VSSPTLPPVGSGCVVTDGRELRVAPSARRALDRPPAKVALAVVEFVLGPLMENPQRVGRPLRGDLVGLYSARVGAYRVVYEIDETNRRVDVLHIAPHHCGP